MKSVGVTYCKGGGGSADFKVIACVCGTNINIQPNCTELDSPVGEGGGGGLRSLCPFMLPLCER